MKVGLYFGSFNPIHVGHLIIANYIINETELDKVWLVVSPQNPFKPSASLLNEYHRLHLVNLATTGDKNIKGTDIEFTLPKPSYTCDTLAYLKEKYPEHDFVIIMGSDSLQNLPKWKNSDWIMKNYKIYVYPRPGFEIEKTAANVTVLNAPLLQLSSTQIRSYSKQGKSLRYMVPDSVLEEIERGGYYKK